jgi:hypothetical protein
LRLHQSDSCPERDPRRGSQTEPPDPADVDVPLWWRFVFTCQAQEPLKMRNLKAHEKFGLCRVQHIHKIVY